MQLKLSRQSCIEQVMVKTQISSSATTATAIWSPVWWVMLWAWRSATLHMPWRRRSTTMLTSTGASCHICYMLQDLLHNIWSCGIIITLTLHYQGYCTVPCVTSLRCMWDHVNAAWCSQTDAQECASSHNAYSTGSVSCTGQWHLHAPGCNVLSGMHALSYR